MRRFLNYELFFRDEEVSNTLLQNKIHIQAHNK